jgi:hypothetical protein
MMQPIAASAGHVLWYASSIAFVAMQIACSGRATPVSRAIAELPNDLSIEQTLTDYLRRHASFFEYGARRSAPFRLNQRVNWAAVEGCYLTLRLEVVETSHDGVVHDARRIDWSVPLAELDPARVEIMPRNEVHGDNTELGVWSLMLHSARPLAAVFQLNIRFLRADVPDDRSRQRRFVLDLSSEEAAWQIREALIAANADCKHRTLHSTLGSRRIDLAVESSRSSSTVLKSASDPADSFHGRR